MDKMRILADLALLKQIKKDLQESSRVGADAAGKTKLALLREKFKNAKKQKDQMTNEKEAASLRYVFVVETFRLRRNQKRLTFIRIKSSGTYPDIWTLTKSSLPGSDYYLNSA